ncbi:MAG: hypothetical protein GY822_30760 [Deltaproteobacteria bacterium]|nr:hypothetical protein [Deltaproteobacteria bacterium]
MIDLHCHLHYGCDDGPEHAQHTIDLARGLVEQGVTKVACTPHIRSDKGWMNTADKQDALLQQTRALLSEHHIPLEIAKGAEHYVDETLFAQPFAGHVVPFADTRWLLIELPYQGEPPGLFELLYRIRQEGYRVLLAHLERFPYVCDHPEKIERLLDSGVLVQVNLGSLAGAYSRAHKKAAQKLLKAGYVSVLSSDCHKADDVKPFIVKGKKVLEKIAPDMSDRLLVGNPAAILDDKDPHRIWP